MMWKHVLLLSLCLCAAATAVTDVNYVTVAGAGGQTGVDWDNAFSQSDWLTDISNSTSGKIYYVKEGTYTWGADNDFSAKDGTGADAYYIIGVKSETTATPPTSSDWAYTTDRPVFEIAGYTLTLGDYWQVRNVDCNGTDATDTLKMGTYASVVNVQCTNNGGVAADALDVGSYANVIASDVNAVGGYALHLTGLASFVAATHFGGARGLFVGNSSDAIVGCTFDGCSTSGIYLASDALRLFGCTFKGCAIVINDVTDAYHCFIANNTFDGCTATITWNSSVPYNWFDYNFYDNVAPTNVTTGPNSDTSTTFALNSGDTDFTYTNSSQAPVGAGLSVSTNTGVTGTYSVSAGVDQDDNTVAGSSGPTRKHPLTGGSIVR